MAIQHKKVPLIQVLLFLIALAALATAFIAEYYFNLVPCSLCVYERYVYGVIAIISVFSFLLQFRKFWLLMQSLILIAGIVLSSYHFGVEQRWFAMPSTCRVQTKKIPQTLKELKQQMKQKTPHARCDEVTWKIFGISATFWNALLLAFMLVFVIPTLRKQRR
jgi:disulfide bond formation protein DsbB